MTQIICFGIVCFCFGGVCGVAFLMWTDHQRAKKWRQQ